MEKIALLHTVQSVYKTFGNQLLEALAPKELMISNTLDEFLSTDANRREEFTKENTRRLLFLLQSKDLEGADLIITTCSTLTPTVEQVRPFLHTPVVAIDDAMMAQAVKKGSRVLIFATAGSAMGPARQKLLLEAAKAGKELVIEEMLCTDAFHALQAGEQEQHDQLLRNAARIIIDHAVDVVVLAQASMAHLQQDIQQISGCPTLSSPRPCFEQVRLLLYGKEDNHAHNQ